MTQTASQNPPLNTARIVTGAIIESGTAVAVDVNLGFTPRYVKIWNETSGDMIEWNDTMADAEGMKRVAAGTASKVTSNGITPSSHGFTIGLDTDINVTAEQMSYLAIG